MAENSIENTMDWKRIRKHLPSNQQSLVQLFVVRRYCHHKLGWLETPTQKRKEGRIQTSLNQRTCGLCSRSLTKLLRNSQQTAEGSSESFSYILSWPTSQSNKSNIPESQDYELTPHKHNTHSSSRERGVNGGPGGACGVDSFRHAYSCHLHKLGLSFHLEIRCTVYSRDFFKILVARL